MLRFGFGAFGALTFLIFSNHTNFIFPSQNNAAGEVGPSDSLLDKAVIEPVHYSRRYGWHCGMRNYGHEHRENCHEGGYWGDT